MQTRDHELLGRYLLASCVVKPNPLCRKLFLLGCIEPDRNIITYARGSIKYQFLHGHNAENAKKHLTHLEEKLMESGIRTPLQWFRFGAALHYLADSFTFAHNQCFTGNLLEHRRYEKRLHEAFSDFLSKQTMEKSAAGEFTHERYLEEWRSVRTDCRYIVGASLTLCRALSMQVSAPNASSYLAYGHCVRRYTGRKSNA